MLGARSRSRVGTAGIAALAGAGLLLDACTGGSNSVDPSAGGEFRFVGATTQGHTIPLAQTRPSRSPIWPLRR